VNSFIGLASYYRKFVPNFATIATPLTNLLRKKQPQQVQWTPECETAFEQLKANLTHSPVLKVPEVNKPYIVYTDASDVGLGATLSQLGDDEKSIPLLCQQKVETKGDTLLHDRKRMSGSGLGIEIL